MEQTVEKVELGKKYRDKLHKIKGVATAICKYLTGCDYVCLEYIKDDGTGPEVKELWLDVVRLEEIAPPVVKKPDAQADTRSVIPRRPRLHSIGGPHDSPSRSKPGRVSTPSR